MQAAPVGSLPREQFVQVVRRVEQQTWGLSESKQQHEAMD